MDNTDILEENASTEPDVEVIDPKLSILTSIKKLLGITEEYEQFDTDIIIHINTVLSILSQMGVGSTTPFSISDKTALWTDFLGTKDDLEMVKSYVYMKVRLMFDPPTSSALNSMTELIKELETRLYFEENYHN